MHRKESACLEHGRRARIGVHRTYATPHTHTHTHRDSHHHAWSARTRTDLDKESCAYTHIPYTHIHTDRHTHTHTHACTHSVPGVHASRWLPSTTRRSGHTLPRISPITFQLRHSHSRQQNAREPVYAYVCASVCVSVPVPLCVCLCVCVCVCACACACVFLCRHHADSVGHVTYIVRTDVSMLTLSRTVAAPGACATHMRQSINTYIYRQTDTHIV
jgi:hypothetical protein